MIVTIKYLAEFFERDERTIHQWVAELGAPKEDRGAYNFVHFVRWRLKKLEADLQKEKLGDETLYELQKEQTRLNNNMKQIKLAQLERQVIQTELVQAAWLTEVKMWVRSLDALAVRINQSIAGDRTTLNKITQEISKLREAIATAQLDCEGVMLEEEATAETEQPDQDDID